jgi:hypothetical protein
MNQLEAVVYGDSLGDFPDSFCNRPGVHCRFEKVNFDCRPKEKVGANPPDENAVLRASCEL